MNRYIIILVSLMLLNVARESQWVEQTSSTTRKQNAVFFVTPMFGFTGGDTGTVQRSTNGGSTWWSMNLGISGNVNVSDIFMASMDTGYCTAANGSLAGKIYRTSDGGAVWTIMFDTTNVGMRDVFFANVNTGWAVGSGGVVKYTSNTGMNWTSRNLAGSSNTCVFAFSPTLVMVGGFSSSGYIARSTNAGANWQFTTVPANLVDYRFLNFPNSNTGYAGGLALGGQGGMAKSTDGGLTWVQLNGYSGSTPLDGYFIDANTGYVVNSSSELKLTTDGGVSWVNQIIPSAGSFSKISGSGSFACIVGRKIATNTAVGIQQISGEVPEEYTLGQNYPNPFNPTTNFELRIADFGFVSVIVYDITGKEIAVLVNEELNAGIYNVAFNAGNSGSGIYIYRMVTNNFSETKKMILIK